MSDNISRLVYGLILGLFAAAMAVGLGTTGIMFVLILALVVLAVLRLSAEKDAALYPVLGIIVGVVLAVALAVTPSSVDGFSGVLAFLISLYSVEHI